MDKKKALIIGGSVVAGSVALYFLLRKKPSTQVVIEDIPSTPTTGDDEENPFKVLVSEGMKWWKSRQDSKEEGAVSKPTYLKRGDSNDRVAALQKFLNVSSGAGLTVNGQFDAATEAAVKAEQDPFRNFEFMYPDSVYGAVSKTYYDAFVKSYE